MFSNYQSLLIMIYYSLVMFFFLCRSTIPLKNLALETSEPPEVTFTWPMFSFVKDAWMLQILYTVKYVKFIAFYILILKSSFAWCFSFYGFKKTHIIVYVIVKFLFLSPKGLKHLVQSLTKNCPIKN